MGMFLSLPEQICDSKLKVFSFIQDPLNGQAKLLVIKTPIKKRKNPKQSIWLKRYRHMLCFVFCSLKTCIIKKTYKEYLKLLSISWSRMLDETHTKKEEEEEVSKILRMDYQNSHLWIPQILIMAHLMA